MGSGVENGEVDEGMDGDTVTDHTDGEMTESIKGQVGVVSEVGGHHRYVTAVTSFLFLVK